MDATAGTMGVTTEGMREEKGETTEGTNEGTKEETIAATRGTVDGTRGTIDGTTEETITPIATRDGGASVRAGGTAPMAESSPIATTPMADAGR